MTLQRDHVDGQVRARLQRVRQGHEKRQEQFRQLRASWRIRGRACQLRTGYGLQGHDVLLLVHGVPLGGFLVSDTTVREVHQGDVQLAFAEHFFRAR